MTISSFSPSCRKPATCRRFACSLATFLVILSDVSNFMVVLLIVLGLVHFLVARGDRGPLARCNLSRPWPWTSRTRISAFKPVSAEDRGVGFTWFGIYDFQVSGSERQRIIIKWNPGIIDTAKYGSTAKSLTQSMKPPNPPTLNEFAKGWITTVWARARSAVSGRADGARQRYARISEGSVNRFTKLCEVSEKQITVDKATVRKWMEENPPGPGATDDPSTAAHKEGK